MLVILIPSQFEAKTLVDGVDGAQEAHIAGADIVRGKIGETSVTVGMIGMGPPHAPLRAEAVIKEALSAGSGQAGLAEKKVRGVILAGFAGALDPTLKRGDIFVTAGAEHLLPHLPEAERPQEAKLATVEKIAGTAAGKKELFEKTGAALCDMEQAYIAEVAKKFGLPFLGIRIVSDEAHENLPSDTLEKAYDQPTGTYTPWKMAGHLTRNPFKTVPLVSFVRLLPPIRSRMSDHLHRWLKQTGPRLFGP
jgi:nucleoside phosphorylase